MLDHQQLIKDGQEVTADPKGFTVLEVLQRNLKNFSHKEALLYVDPASKARESLTYAELVNQVLTLANYLKKDQGLTKGATVALNLENTPEILIFHLACWLIGCITVPLDLKRDDPDKKKYKLELTDCQLVIVDENSDELELFEQLKPGIKVLPVSKKIREEIAKGESVSLGSVETDLDNTGLILFTSGTTHLPKGVQLSMANLMLNADGIREWLKIEDQDRFHIVLPLHHINSTTMSLATLLAGGTIVLSARYSKSNFWRIMAENKCTLSSIVPTICFDMLSEEQAFKQYQDELTQVTRIQLGSAPVKPTDVIKFYNLYGIKLIQGYGSTETALRVTGVEWAELTDKDYRQQVLVNTIGKERKWNNVEIIKADGNIAGEKEEGEICIRGPVVTKGYLKNDQANGEAFVTGWFHSGDVGYWQQTSAGKNIFLSGRIKEIIIKGGVNISPLVIEHAILKHYQDISTCFVAAVPDERYGEEIGVVVSFADSVGQEQRQAVMDQLSADAREGKIAGVSVYESPKYILEVPLASLPKTSTGKIQRVKIKAYFKASFTKIAETKDHLFKRLTPFDTEYIQKLVEIHNTRWGAELGMTVESATEAVANGVVIGAINKERGELVGSAFAERVFSEDVNKQAGWLSTYDSATSNLMLKPHTDDGDALMFVTISTEGKPLVPDLSSDDPQYLEIKHRGEGLIEQYLAEKVDPVMNFHARAKAGMSAGAEILYPLPEARPQDTAALGFCVMIKYPPLPDDVRVQEDSSLGTQILEAGFKYAAANNIRTICAYSRPSGFLKWVRK